MPFDEHEEIEFDESWYLQRYPDIADAVSVGSLASGLSHYIAHGRQEGREGLPPAFEIFTYVECALSAETIFPAQNFTFPSALRYSNCEDHDAALAERLRDDIYGPRILRMPAIAIFRLPVGTKLYGGHEALAGADNYLFREQMRIPSVLEPITLSRATSDEWPVVELAAPCLLATRYGAPTWGHWIADILPKIVIAEKYFPGRFSYALPDWVFSAERWIESLCAYQIPLDRILPIQHGKTYVFRELFALSETRYDKMLHPSVSTLMDKAISIPDERSPLNKTLLLRDDTPNRRVTNSGEVRARLKDAGFIVSDIASLSFLEQVRLFRESAMVASIIGSGMTGLIYSPPGVEVISLSPPQWVDNTFYSIVQQKFGGYADVRGHITRPAQQSPNRDSDFQIDMNGLELALSALTSCP